MSAEVRPAAVSWDAIERLVADVAALGADRLSAREYYTGVLARTCTTLGAVCGAAWLQGADGQLYLESQHHLAPAAVGMEPLAQRRHARMIRGVVTAGASIALPPGAASPHDPQAGNVSPWLALASPLRCGAEVVGAIELFDEPAAPAEERLRVLEAICELAGEFNARRQLVALRGREASQAQLARFALAIHAHLDLEGCAAAVVNEARRLVEADRVSLAVKRRGRLKLLAVSGVDAPDRRSHIVRAVEKLAAAVTATGQPLWYGEGAAEYAPQLEAALLPYLEQASARQVVVLPLVAAPQSADGPAASAKPPLLLGALVVEHFSARTHDEEFRQSLAVAAEHSAQALRNAVEYDSLPLLPLERATQGALSLVGADRWPKTLAVLAALAAVVAALGLIPADFTIEAEGQLQPRVRRDVFAPIDGVVEQVHVNHGQQVSADAPLVVLRSADLDLQLRRTEGELQTTEEKRSSLAAMLRNQRPTTEAEEQRYAQLSAEAAELQSQAASLRGQLEILRSQEGRLSVRAPQAGCVTTWNVQELLMARPVNRGQTLLSVADLSGPWAIELRIADRRVGHVLAAQQESKSPLAVTYLLATDPRQTHETTLGGLGLASDPDAEGQSGVSAWAPASVSSFVMRRPGASVTARIHCGRRAIGYVWLHDLIDAVRAWWAW